MAPEEEKTTVEVPEGAETEEKPKKGGNKLILFGGIGLGAIILGVVLTVFVVRPMMSGDGGETADGDHVEQAAEEDHGSSKDEEESDGHGGGKAGDAIVYAIDDIVVNPANTGGSRFLAVSFGFELGSSKIAGDFESRELIVRDALITILSSKTVAQLTDSRQKEVIRYQIKKRLSKLLETDQIKGVYYTDFVLQ